jgi:ABC-2 type transport system ATP-binding protein
MTTHVLEIAEQMCDRVGILDDGRLIAVGTVDQLRREHGSPEASLEDIFLGLTGSADRPDLRLYAGAAAD